MQAMNCGGPWPPALGPSRSVSGPRTESPPRPPRPAGTTRRSAAPCANPSSPEGVSQTPPARRARNDLSTADPRGALDRGLLPRELLHIPHHLRVNDRGHVLERQQPLVALAAGDAVVAVP